jgi:hypothetical protein
MASYRDEIKEIAKLLGLDQERNADGSRQSVTASRVVKAVAELVKERDTLRDGKRKREPEPPQRYVEPRVNQVFTSIDFGRSRDETMYVPLNGGFRWDDRLTVALTRVNHAFSDQFSFDFDSVGLKGGEAFSNDGNTYLVVGLQPKRPKFQVVGVKQAVLADPKRELKPKDFRMFKRRAVGC